MFFFLFLFFVAMFHRWIRQAFHAQDPRATSTEALMLRSSARSVCLWLETIQLLRLLQPEVVKTEDDEVGKAFRTLEENLLGGRPHTFESNTESV